VSLDHDLGGTRTGYDLCKWMEEKVWTEDWTAPIISVHTSNPVGRMNMLASIESIRWYIKNEE